MLQTGAYRAYCCSMPGKQVVLRSQRQVVTTSIRQWLLMPIFKQHPFLFTNATAGIGLPRKRRLFSFCQGTTESAALPHMYNIALVGLMETDVLGHRWAASLSLFHLSEECT